MPPGPNFYETFNPEAVVPLAMKKFDIDLKKRQLDMMEQEHNIKVEASARKIAAEQEWKNFLQGSPVTSSAGEMPEDTGKTETKMVPPSPQAMYRKALEFAGPGEVLKSLSPKSEQFGASAGRIYNKVTGEISSEKPATPPAPVQSDVAKKLIDVYGQEAFNRMTAEERITGFKKLTETAKSPSESLTEAALTQKALRGDQEAQAILDAMQKRKINLAEAQLDVKSKEIDIPGLADSVKKDQMAGAQIRGSMGNPVLAKVQSEVRKEYPNFNFQMNDANFKWKSSQTNQRTINFVGGALPRVSALVTQLNQLPNVDLNAINRIMRVVSRETGRPEYTDFESNRNAIVQEINTALSGSATQSDMRIKIEMENLSAARSPRQILGALNNLNEALIARMDVDLSPIYPIDVVQGKKTIEEYKKELFEKYRGKFDAPGLAHTQGARAFEKSAPKKVGRFTIEAE